MEVVTAQICVLQKEFFFLTQFSPYKLWSSHGWYLMDRMDMTKGSFIDVMMIRWETNGIEWRNISNWEELKLRWIELTCMCSTELRALLEPARGSEPSLEMLLGCSSSPLMLLLLPLRSSSSSPRSDFLLPLRISCSRGVGKVNWWPTRDLNWELINIMRLMLTSSQEMVEEWSPEGAPPEMRIWAWWLFSYDDIGTKSDHIWVHPSSSFVNFLPSPESVWFALTRWRWRQGRGTTVSALTAGLNIKMTLVMIVEGIFFFDTTYHHL